MKVIDVIKLLKKKDIYYRRIDFLMEISKHRFAYANQLAKTMGISVSLVKKQLQFLEQHRLIEKINPDELENVILTGNVIPYKLTDEGKKIVELLNKEVKE